MTSNGPNPTSIIDVPWSQLQGFGFDLYPPLQNTEHDRQLWAPFLHRVRSQNWPDSSIAEINNFAGGYLLFFVADGPALPNAGHLFRRFATYVSNPIDTQDRAWAMITTVKRLASEYLGAGRVITYRKGEAGHEGYSDEQIRMRERAFGKLQTNPPGVRDARIFVANE